jgi:hypothetical protein
VRRCHAPLDVPDEEGEPPKMTRSILIVILVGAFLATVAGSGCAPGGVGDPCIPEAEYNTCFAGFSQTEVNTESRSFQCQTRLCLVNHFQGRVSCPYGQTAQGTGQLACQDGTTPMGGPPYVACTSLTASATNTAGAFVGCPSEPTCTIPGGATVIGSATSTLAQQFQIQVSVPAQVTPRQTENAVYCSCRCANAEGNTNDGEVYCQCPDGFECAQQLVTQISASNGNLAGGYCIKSGTAYNSLALGEQVTCDPVLGPKCP